MLFGKKSVRNTAALAGFGLALLLLPAVVESAQAGDGWHKRHHGHHARPHHAHKNFHHAPRHHVTPPRAVYGGYHQPHWGAHVWHAPRVRHGRACSVQRQQVWTSYGWTVRKVKVCQPPVVYQPAPMWW